MANTDQVMTPPTVGPAADPALLANSGANADAQEVGFNLAVNTMQKFGRELENLPTEGRRLVERALSSVSTANQRTSMRTSTSQRGSRKEKLAEPDAFVRIVTTLGDLTPSTIPVRALVDTLVLSSIVLTAFSLASLLSNYLFASLISLLIPPVGAALVSAIVAPSLLYLTLTRGYGPIDGFWLILLTGSAQGVLSGAALANLSVYAEPFIALSSISSAFAISMSGQKSRTALLSIAIGTSLTLHLALGALEGALSPVYLTLTTLYTLATLIPVQLAARDQSNANSNLYSCVLIGMSIAVKLCAYGMLGAGPMAVEELGAVGGGQEGMEQVTSA